MDIPESLTVIVLVTTTALNLLFPSNFVEMSYVPCFKLIANDATPLASVSTVYVLPRIMNLIAVLAIALPLLSFKVALNDDPSL